MPKVLILCHDFPPFISAAALRPGNWFKTAPDAGFEAVVVCVGDEEDASTSAGGTVIRVQRKPQHSQPLLRKATTLLGLLTEHFTDLFDAKREIYVQAARYLEQNPGQVKAIIASAGTV